MKMKTDRLQIVINDRQQELHIFSVAACDEGADLQLAVTEGMKAFGKAFHKAIVRARRSHTVTEKIKSVLSWRHHAQTKEYGARS